MDIEKMNPAMDLTTPLFGGLADTGHQAEASFLFFKRPEPEGHMGLCSLCISVQTGGMLYLDHNEYGIISAGITEINELNPGIHHFRIEYEPGPEEEQEVELIQGKNADIIFTWKHSETEPGQEPLDLQIQKALKKLFAVKLYENGVQSIT